MSPIRDPSNASPVTVALGIDIGGTKVLGVRLALREATARREVAVEVLERIHLPVALGAGSSPRGVAAQVADVASVLSVHDVDIPVGIGVAGYVDLEGIPQRSPNVPQVVGVDLRAEVTRRLGVVPVVDNDANCVAVAAARLRRGSAGDLVAVTFGTGIGAGFMSGWRLVRGAHGFAGEPGHMVVQRDGIPCVCGQAGCWERYASGSRLSDLAASAFASGKVRTPTQVDSAPGGAPRSVRAGELLVEAARSGDPGAIEVLHEFCGWLALGMANIVNLVDPEVIVVGGGLSVALDVLGGPLRTEMERNPTIAGRMPVIEAAPMADASGAVGAALMALEAAGGDPEMGSGASGSTG
ncbi:MAG: ROK family protein [Microthrixaceae bacterium]